MTTIRMPEVYAHRVKCIRFYIETGEVTARSKKPVKRPVVQRTLFVTLTNGHRSDVRQFKFFQVRRKGQTTYSLRIKKMIPQSIWENPTGRAESWCKEDTEWTPEIGVNGRPVPALTEDEFTRWMAYRFKDKAQAVINEFLTAEPVPSEDEAEGMADAA